MNRMILSGVAAAIAGFLTRPCCVIPAAMSVAGVGSAGLAQAAVAYRPGFLAASIVMLSASLWMAARRQGGWFTKIVAVFAILVGFVVSWGPF